MLLARRGIEPKKGEWDLLGGFLEFDETPKECAKRELEEETGLKIKLEEFLGFCPDRYCDNQNERELSVLTIGYKARRKEKKKPTPKDDVGKLDWFELDNLPSELAFDNTKYFLDKVTE